MKKYGGFIPGIRPGKRTAEYIDRILTRITLPGAFFLAFIAVLPDILIKQGNAAVLLRRHRTPHRGRRDARHAPADRVAPPDAALRRIHEEGPPAGQTVLGGFGVARMHIVIFGPPGSGKGTQAARIAREARPRAPVDGGHAPRRRGAQDRSRRRGGDLHEARAPRFGRDHLRSHRRGARRGEGHGLDHGRFSAEPRAGRDAREDARGARGEDRSRARHRRRIRAHRAEALEAPRVPGVQGGLQSRFDQDEGGRRYATRAAGPSSSVPTTRKTRSAGASRFTRSRPRPSSIFSGSGAASSP